MQLLELGQVGLQLTVGPRVFTAGLLKQPPGWSLPRLFLLDLEQFAGPLQRTLRRQRCLAAPTPATHGR